MRNNSDLDDMLNSTSLRQSLSSHRTLSRILKTHANSQIQRVPSSKAITRRSKVNDTLTLERVDDLVQNGPRDTLTVLADPSHEVVSTIVQRVLSDSVTREVIGDVSRESILGKVIREELSSE